jgi:hypothetical protein
MDFSAMPGPGAFLFFGALICALCLTFALAGLKFCGVLLPVPALIVAALVIVGIAALLD